MKTMDLKIVTFHEGFRADGRQELTGDRCGPAPRCLNEESR